MRRRERRQGNEGSNTYSADLAQPSSSNQQEEELARSAGAQRHSRERTVSFLKMIMTRDVCLRRLRRAAGSATGDGKTNAKQSKTKLNKKIRHKIDVLRAQLRACYSGYS